MPQRINCQHCGKSFSVWDGLAGQLVQCPKCQQRMQVPGGDQLPDLSAAMPAAAPRTVPNSDRTAKSHSPQPAAGPGSFKAPPSKTSASAPPRPAAASETSRRAAAPTPDARRQPTAGQPAATDLDGNDALPFACPHCQQPMPRHEDLCDHCGYHRVLKRCLDTSDIRKPDHSTGFERMFRRQLHDADSAEGTLRLLKIVGLLAALVFLFVCHPWSWLIAIAAVVGFLLWRRQRAPAVPSAAPDSTINQDPLSGFLWYGVLAVQRTIGWREAQWPFRSTRALTLHDPTFTDADLAELNGLHDFETLDLEGTQISNEGLRHLETMKHLRFLVFRRTQVTAAGVQRLQPALPQTWIWY